MLLNEALIKAAEKAYQPLEIFNFETRKMAIEIAKKYSCSTEHVVNVIMKHGFDKEDVEKHIQQDLMRARF